MGTNPQDILPQDEGFCEVDGLRLDGLDVFVEDGRRFIRLEDDVYFFKLDMAEAAMLRAWLDAALP